MEVDEVLLDYRREQEGFIEPSFPTIAGADGHGAIIHYRATDATSKKIDNTTMLLVDSGAQFDCGTTDVTRTVHFGTPSATQKNAFTRVLKGHIALDKATFPEKTPGFVLDILARQYLWQNGLGTFLMLSSVYLKIVYIHIESVCMKLTDFSLHALQ